MSFKSQKQRFCGNAVAWIQSSLQEFDPTNGKSNRKLRIKAYSELLLISYLYKRRFNALPPPFDEFVSFGLDVTQRMNYSDGVHRKPELILPYSMVYKSLRGCDVTLPNLKESIQSMLNIGLPMASEDNPYRIMELRYALEDGGFEHLPPTLESLYRNTSFHKPLRDAPPVLSLGLDQVYGLTHLVFYLTGFGFSNRRVPELASLRWLVSAQLGLQSLERNWDAVAELLMCCKFLGYFPSPFYKSAWFSLIRAQKSDGSLTDNFFDVKKYESMSIPENRIYYFEQHYHTTLVAAAAAFLTEEGDIARSDPLYPTSRRQQLPDCAKALKRARAWMIKKYSEQSQKLELSSLLHILVGDWISSLAVDGRHPERSRRLYQKIQDDLARSINASRSALEDCDPALVFLGEGILRNFDLGLADFELLAGRSVEALKSDSRLDSRGSRLFPVRYLLESLGFNFDDDEQPRDLKEEVAADYLGVVSDESLLAFINYVSKRTLFGSLRFRPEESRLADETRAHLAALTYHRLFHYKLDEGLMLIRAMNYAGMNSSKPFGEAIRYILAQQREDGSFGFYAEEAALIRRSNQGFDPSQRITIPTTVSAIWTISEATVEGFSLFPSIRAAAKRKE
jgi:hypothetical protein